MTVRNVLIIRRSIGSQMAEVVRRDRKDASHQKVMMEALFRHCDAPEVVGFRSIRSGVAC